MSTCRPPEPPTEGEVILVVDDVEIVRHVTRRMLEATGYVVIEASGGEEAIVVFTNGDPRPRLVLSDVDMPGMRGTELARELKRIDPAVAVILVSGDTEAAISQRETEGEVTAYLEKPFNWDSLHKAVRDALRI